MSNVTANGQPVSIGTIVRPRRGAWTADLTVPADSGFDAGTQVTIQTPTLTLVGTVLPDKAGTFVNSSHFRVVGGAAGLMKAASARYYAQPQAFASDVVSGLLDDGAETLSATADAGFLGTNLDAWTVASMTVKRALEHLIEVVDDSMGWRVLDDGSVWIGKESWPSVTLPDAVSITFDPTNQTYVLGEDAPAVSPGTNVAGIGNIDRVEHQIEADSIRTVVYVASDSAEERGYKAALKTMIDGHLARRGFDFTKQYLCKVVKQSADNATVEVTPNDSSLPGLTNVAVMWGLPGCTAQIQPGDFCMVAFLGASPASPVAFNWQPSSGAIVVNINGGDYWLLKTDDFLSDLALFIPAVVADLASAAAAPVSPYTATVSTTSMFAKAVTASGVPYKSTKAKNG